MQPQSTRFVLLDRRTLSLSIALILAFAIAAPALADYLGPDRTTTSLETVRDPENDIWFCLKDGAPADHPSPCFLHHIDNPCPDAGGSHPGTGQQEFHCGWIADSCGCDAATKEELVEITLPEATIAGQLLNCSLVDGWCTKKPTLHLTASEPVAGEFITIIEGTRNGEAFACDGETCDIPLLEGDNDFTYWAHSSWGDTSQQGELSAKVDSQGPSIGILEAWYIWEPLAIHVDDPRGVARIELTVKGGEYGNRHYQWNLANLPGDWIWDRYFGDIVAPIGEYPVTVEAWDALGNGSTARGTIVIPPPEDDSAADSLALLSVENEAEVGALADSSEPSEEPSAPMADVIVPTPTPGALAAVVPERPPESANRSEPARATAATSTVRPIWGAAAAVVSYLASSYALSRRASREEEAKRLRREAVKSASSGSLKHRMARLYERFKPRKTTAPAPATNTERAQQEADLSAAAAAATVARWQAMAQFYKEKAERDAERAAAEAAQASAIAARERALAARREKLTDAWSRRETTSSVPGAGQPSPVLEPVPSILSNPLGWLQATAINAGRTNEAVGEILVSTLSPLAEGIEEATPVSQDLVASAINSVGAAITHTSSHARMALGWEPLPEGASRWGASAEAVYGLGNLVTLGGLGDVRYGVRDRDWLRVGLGAVSLIPGSRIVVGIGRSGATSAARIGTRILTKVDDVLRLSRPARVAVGHADEVAELGRAAWIYKPTISTSSNVPANAAAVTDRYGNIVIREGLSEAGYLQALYHEKVHSFFSPRLMVFRESRARFLEWAYWKSHLFRYIEEGLAQGIAIGRLHGFRRGLVEGLRYPIAYNYRISLPRLIGEALAGGGLVGGLLEAAHRLGESLRGKLLSE